MACCFMSTTVIQHLTVVQSKRSEFSRILATRLSLPCQQMPRPLPISRPQSCCSRRKRKTRWRAARLLRWPADPRRPTGAAGHGRHVAAARIPAPARRITGGGGATAVAAAGGRRLPWFGVLETCHRSPCNHAALAQAPPAGHEAAAVNGARQLNRHVLHSNRKHSYRDLCNYASMKHSLQPCGKTARSEHNSHISLLEAHKAIPAAFRIRPAILCMI